MKARKNSDQYLAEVMNDPLRKLSFLFRFTSECKSCLSIQRYAPMGDQNLKILVMYNITLRETEIDGSYIWGTTVAVQ